MRFICLAITLLFFTTTSFCQQLSFEDVKDSINSIIKEQDLPGISLSIINLKDSFTWSGGFGMADIENNVPMTENSTMYVASVSKNLIAIGFLKLVEEGKIKLNTPIKQIVPEINFDNPWKDEVPITVEMVLEHTTGFDDTRYNNLIGEDKEHLSLEELLNKYPNGLHSRWKPGTLFSYSNMNYTLAGYIIEKVTGIAFESYLQRTVLDPLDMDQTRLLDFTTKTHSLAKPYGFDFANDSIVPFFPNRGVGKNFLQRPAGFLITSSKDMLKYLQMYLSPDEEGNSIITDISLDRMENGTTGYHSQLKMPGRYGLGNKPGLREVRLFGHSGNAWNQAFLMYNRSEKIGYYLATNCGYPIPEVRRLLNAFLLQDYSVKEVKEQISTDIVKPFEGFYEAVNSRNELLLFFDKFRFAGTLAVKNDTVFFDGGLKQRKFRVLDGATSQSIPLVRVDKGFEKQQNFASMGLMYDENNDPLIVWDSGRSMVYFKKKSPFLHYFTNTALFGSPILLALATLIILIRSPYRLIKRNFQFSYYQTAIVLAMISFAAMIYIFLPVGPFELIKLGEMNFKTVSFFVLSLLFPIYAVICVQDYVRTLRKSVSIPYQVIRAMICLSLLYLNYFMLENKLTGLQFWDY